MIETTINRNGEEAYVLTLEQVNKLVYQKIREVVKSSRIIDSCPVDLTFDGLMRETMFERRNPKNDTFLGMEGYL